MRSLSGADSDQWSPPPPVFVNENVLDSPVLALILTLNVLPDGASGNVTLISHLPSSFAVVEFDPYSDEAEIVAPGFADP